MATTAAVYYQHQGFVKTDTNDPLHLPQLLLKWCEQAKNEKATTLFVYFVTDAELIKDAICNKKDPNSPEVQARFMHLLKLEGLLKLTGSAKEVKAAHLVKHCLPECSNDTAFLQFPFSDTGVRMNAVSARLFLLDHIWFKFKDARDNTLHEPIEGIGTSNKWFLNFKSYFLLKNNVATKTYKQWLNDNHINFFQNGCYRTNNHH